MSKPDIQYFILTRFNLLLWNKDKEGNKVRTKGWLEHRFTLFEQYCLPSIKNQTYQDFEWIVLFDSTTPEEYKDRIEQYTIEFPQFFPVFVKPEGGQCFPQVFRDEVAKRLDGNRVLTTYLDNDDALSIHFVEDLQKRAESLGNGTFINYVDGYQYYTDHNYLMQIHYPRNHFMSVVEEANPATIKTIYGYGSHYYIEKIPGVKIENVTNQPMWCEVIHEKNMGNDAYFLSAKMVKADAVASGFRLQVSSFKSGLGVYLFRYLPRYCKTFIRRCGYFIFRNRFK